MKKATVNISKELQQRLKVYVAKNPPQTIQFFVEKAVTKYLDKVEINSQNIA